jgi:hypothetical protein
VHYRPRSSPCGLYRQMFRYGAGRARLFRTHFLAVPWALMLVTALVLLVPVVCVVLGRAVGMLMLWSPVAAWLALVVEESIRVSTVGTRAWRVAIAFVVIYGGLTVGFWWGMATPWRSLRGVHSGCR